MIAGLSPQGDASAPCARQGADRFEQHEAADEPHQRDVGDVDEKFELPGAPQCVEGPDADDGARDTARDQNEGKLAVERPPTPVGEGASRRGGGDLRRLRRDGDSGGDADEDEQRRHQKPAADPEHARNKADRDTHAEDEEHIHGKFGDRQVDLHRSGLTRVKGVSSACLT